MTTNESGVPDALIIFNRKKDAHRVSRRLRDFNVLSRVVGREVHMMVPPSRDAQSCWELAKAIYYGVEG